MNYKTVLQKTILVITLSLFLLIRCSAPSVEVEKEDITNAITSLKVYQYTTADSTSLRLSLLDTLEFAEHGQPLETQVTIFVDPSQHFQTLIGIGGAITDASAETFAKLPLEKQEELLNAYYNQYDGIGYTLARTHINSCDFSSSSYTYVDEGDASLSSFDISHDKQYRIPLIQQAIKKANQQLTLFVSPWSPPAWMKDNNSMLRGGKLKPEFYQSWANYYVRFIKAYEAEGIPVWGLTVQNEPMATQTWESCIYTAEEERDFIKNYLGPTLKQSGLSDKKLIAWDHNRDLIYQRAQQTLSDPEASKYIWGIGFHWYEDWKGGQPMFENVRKVHERWPDKNLIFTEGCISPFVSEKIKDWSLGEHYGNSMIEDFNAGTVAWTDWNILLDETGGPNHVQNFCFAPVHADTKTGELIYTNAFYYLGHFSKFIRPGAKRIQAASSFSKLQTTAFENSDGSIVVVVMNSSDDEIPFFLWIDNLSVQRQALPHSISTFVLK